MSEFLRNTAYLYLYEHKQPVRSVGFLKRNRRYEDDKLQIHIRGFYTGGNETGQIYAIMEHGDHFDTIPLGEIEIENSSGEIKMKVSEKVAEHVGISVRIQEQECIGWYDESMKYSEINYPDESAEQEQGHQRVQFELQKERTEQAEESQKLQAEVSSAWNRLEQVFPMVYPFEYPVDADYISITPNEILSFDESERILINNSFLQHAYYNYKYIILGRKHKKPEQDEQKTEYVIGVPGVYHDREIMMAKMFGFEDFLSAKKEQPGSGCFGYYLKQVKV